MEMKELGKMSNPDLVVWAITNGFRVRGMNREEILELIESSKQEPVVAIANRPSVEDDLATPRIYNPPLGTDDKASQEKPSEDVSKISWTELQKLAKAKGINIHKKKRNEIETLLKEQNNA